MVKTKSISINVMDNHKARPWISKDGVLSLPPKGYFKEPLLDTTLNYWDIIYEDAHKLVVEFCRVSWSGVCKKQWCTYTVEHNDDGFFKLQENDSNPIWLEKINEQSDMVRNPTNVYAHQYIIGADPLYESENFYITCLKKLYVRVRDNFWVPIEDSFVWVDKNKDYMPRELMQELKRHELVEQLSE